MEIIVAIIGGLFTVVAAVTAVLVQRFRRENSDQHAEGRRLIEAVHADVLDTKADVRDVKQDVRDLKPRVQRLEDGARQTR